MHVDASSANLMRKLVNCTTAQTVSPYTPECVYARLLFMSIAHRLTACLRPIRFSLGYTTG